MTEKISKNLYTLEQAEDEAGKIKEKIDNGEAGDYQSAEEKYQEQIIRDMVDNFDPNKLADIPAIYHKEIALKLIESGKGKCVVENLEKFQGLDHKEVILKLIESGEKECVVKYLKKFQGLDKNIYIKLIQVSSSLAEKILSSYFNQKKNLERKIIFQNNEGPEIETITEVKDDLTKIFNEEDLADLVLSSGFEKVILRYIDKFKDISFVKASEVTQFSPGEYYLLQNMYSKLENAFKENSNEIWKEAFHELKSRHELWNDQENIAGPFEEGGEYFGYDKMFKYIGKRNRHDTLYNFRKIVALAKQSGLKPGQFYGQILKQVAMDYAVYGELDNEICSYQLLNSIADSVDPKDFENIIREASRYQDVEALQKLLANFEKVEDVFNDWKSLRKYYELIQLLGRAEVLEQLQQLKKEPGKEKLYKYVETLAFHPNIDMRKVFELWQEPESFLGIKEDHASDFHEMKKPSNYIYIPHLDLSAEEMIDALVEGDLDRLQAWKPLQIEYELPEDLSVLDKNKTDLRLETIRGLGSMKKGIEGEAKDAKKLFKELNDLFKKRKLKLTDYLQSESFPLPHDLKEEIKNKLYNAEIGIKEAKEIPTSKFRARINLKSDPNGIVAGNDTACCMPFGSGKNNVYTFNPICALFTLEKKINNKWRTIAQSVMTKDADIKMKIPEILEEMERPGAQIHQIVPEEALIREKSIMTADNVEVAPNFKSNPNAGQILEKIYRDFFKEYAELFSKQDNLDESKLIIGKNYSDALTHLRRVDNTFAPLAPVGYSDNIGEEALMLNLEKSSEAEFFVKREVKQEEKPQREDDPGIKAKNISPLTFEDALHVAYLEGKIYDGTSLLRGLHNMENALIAKDINNTAKERKNLSFKYVNEKGKVGGYILAYEGISNGESVIYITDLAASPEEKMAGGRLILAFVEAYKKNYVDQNRLVPILAEARDKTSYPIIKKNLVAMAKKLGVNAILEELDDDHDGGYDDGYDESGNYGTEKMHRILIRMEK